MNTIPTEARAAQSPAAERSPPLPGVFLAPLVPWAWPALAALAARSEVPRFLGRWSTSFLAFNLLDVVAVALIVVACRRGRTGWLQAGYGMLVLLTVLAPMNNQLRALPAIAWLLPVVRLVTGAALALAAFEAYRRRRRQGVLQHVPMALGAVLVVLSLVDLTLLGWIALDPGRRMDDTGLREDYALETIGAHDVVIVGDSFVWGQGVAREERFGDVLETLYARDGEPVHVFSLGQKGFGLVQYAEILARVPADVEAQRVVLALYLNDMPPQETWGGKVQDAGTALGRGFPSVRLLGDKVARLLTPDVDAYHAFVVASWDERHPTYARRWLLMEERIRELYRLAAVRSADTPLVLVLPLMVDFDDYPLESAHERLGVAARRAGFEVEDLLPVFRAELGDGTAHRNDPADNHFDAATHALVARLLRERLRSEPRLPGS